MPIRDSNFLFSAMKRTPCLEDLDLMPFGKYKNKLMQDVPSSYLAWLKDDMENAGGPNNENAVKVYNYVMNSWDAIKQDIPDRV